MNESICLMSWRLIYKVNIAAFSGNGGIMDYIRVNSDNIAKEHVCCAISSENDVQVRAKKDWLRERFDDGLVFLRGNVRGKFFIEYIPAERAWTPVDAEGYMYIDCFWIAGQFKGHGYASDLLGECIRDSRERGMRGLCVTSSQKKKMPFLSDPSYLAHAGFKEADTADPFFSLMYLPFDKDAPMPRYKECAKHPDVTDNGYVLYYSHQCPYTAKYVPLVELCARERGIQLTTIRLATTEEAQNAPTPFTAYTLFKDGKFVTNEILNEQRFLKISGIV